jgi:hypothetical protein
VLTVPDFIYKRNEFVLKTDRLLDERIGSQEIIKERIMGTGFDIQK